MTGNELADHLTSLIEVLRRHGDRRINGLTLDVCDVIELTIPTAEAERQRRRRRGGGAPPGVTPSVTPGVQNSVTKRDENRSESVTAAPPLAPPLHSPSLPTLGFSALSSSSKTESKDEEEAAEGVTESVTRTPVASVTNGARVSCPTDLALLPAQVATLETSLIGRFHINAMTVEYVAKYAGDEAERRTVGEWRRGLVKTITSSWNDPRQRRMQSDGPAAPRQTPVPDRSPRPIQLGTVPTDILDRISPPRAAAGPARSRAEQLEALKAFEEQERQEAAGDA